MNFNTLHSIFVSPFSFCIWRQFSYDFVFFPFLYNLNNFRIILSLYFIFSIWNILIKRNILIRKRRIKFNFLIRFHRIAWCVYILFFICSILYFIIIICLSYYRVYLKLEFLCLVKHFLRYRISFCFFHFINCF